MSKRRLNLCIGLAMAWALTCCAPAQEKSVNPGINKPFADPDLKKFLGTFEGESREIFALRQEIVRACKLKPALVVADIGAGTGLFTRMFAKEVAETGKVYAVDIAPKFLDHIAKSAKEVKLTNIKLVKCSQTSAELPANSIDFAFICDTYHHFEFPHKTMTSIHQALKPGGEVVVIDFHRIPGKSREWVLGHVRAGQEKVEQEIADSGFKKIGEEKFLKENYFTRFRKAETAQ